MPAMMSKEKAPFEVIVVQSLSKITYVTLDRYHEKDGRLVPDDDLCLEKEFKKGEFTPLMLINAFAEILPEIIETRKTASEKTAYKHMLDECRDWIEDDYAVIREID